MASNGAREMARRGIIIATAALLMVFSLVYWPATLWGKNQVKTSHVVDYVDILHITMRYAPFGVAVLAHILLSPDPTNGAIQALNRDPQVAISKPKFFVPKWKLYARIGSWSLGEVIIVLVLIVCNFVWWILPVISRFVAPPPHSGHGHGHSTHELNAEAFFSTLAAFAGTAGMWDAGLAIVLAVRENHLTKAAFGNHGGQYLHAIKFHIGVGYVSFALLTYHSLYYFFEYLAKGIFIVAMSPWKSNGGYFNFFGLVSFVALLIMTVTSIYKVRRWNFRVFYWSHQFYVLFLVAACMHFYVSWYFVIGPLLYFVYDRLAGRLNVKRDTVALVSKASDNVVKMVIPLSAGYHSTNGYAPGDYVNVAVPSISALNWHAFSIASYYEASPDRITLYVRTGGHWTTELLRLCHKPSGEIVQVPVKVDGIFGARSTSYLSYDSLVLVAGGTGMAALYPFLKHYTAVHSAGQEKVGVDVHLIWVAKNKGELRGYEEILSDLNNPIGKLGCNVKVHLFLTREKSREALLTIDAAAKTIEANETIKDASKTFTNVPIVGSENSSIETSRNKLGNKLGASYAFGTLLTLAVFGIGIAFYCATRILQFRYNSALCRVKLSYATRGVDHFICFYWYPTAPIIIPIVVAVLFGWIVAVVHDQYRQRRAVASNGILEDGRVDSALNIHEKTLTRKGNAEGLSYSLAADAQAFLDAAPYQKQRPNFAKLFDELEIEFEAAKQLRGGGGDGLVAVLAAGPEGLMNMVEIEVVGKRGTMHFYRESWKYREKLDEERERKLKGREDKSKKKRKKEKEKEKDRKKRKKRKEKEKKEKDKSKKKKSSSKHPKRRRTDDKDHDGDDRRSDSERSEDDREGNGSIEEEPSITNRKRDADRNDVDAESGRSRRSVDEDGSSSRAASPRSSSLRDKGKEKKTDAMSDSSSESGSSSDDDSTSSGESSSDSDDSDSSDSGSDDSRSGKKSKRKRSRHKDKDKKKKKKSDMGSPFRLSAYLHGS
ncbi:hypothetical protein HK102_004893 [Quaeritorhiza haematococci]|nr:hypothetical protein HK102_004893 [Quaeritorhiza haematococci]